MSPFKIALLLFLASCGLDRTTNSISSAETRVFNNYQELPTANQIQISEADEPGDRIALCLTFIDKETQEAIVSQKVHFYHTDIDGNYQPSNPRDESTARLNGSAITNAEGQILLKTILPGDYGSSTDNRHIHTTVFGAKPEAYDIHFKQYTCFMGKQSVGSSDQHFLADLKRNSDGSLIAFLTIEVKNATPTKLVKPALVSLIVENLETSVNWYKDILGFDEDTLMSFPDQNNLAIQFLKLGDFKLELIAKEKSVKIDRSKLPNEYANVEGLIKIGFVSNDLQKINEKAKINNAAIIVEPADLPPLASGRSWPNRFSLLQDPDGNYVQFFKGDEVFNQQFQLAGTSQLAPFLAMYSVENFDESIAWFQENIGFEYIEGVGEPGNQRAILFLDNFVLEIGSFEDDQSVDELGLSEISNEIIRLNKLGFATNQLEDHYAKMKEKNIPLLLEKMDSSLTKKNFIIEDPEGNPIQFFGQ